MESKPTAEGLWDRLSERSRQLCVTVAERAAERGERIYLVGGSVRDLLLGEPEADLDIVVEGDAVGLASVLVHDVQGHMHAPSEFLTVAIDLPGEGHLDLATARQETYPAPAKLPLVKPATIVEDLRRRDFSINAMAFRVLPGGGGEPLDPCHGQRDAAAGLIRILHDRSFIDDPTRLLRAIRFEQRLGFVVESGTLGRFQDAVRSRQLARVTGPRLRDEVVKALGEPAPWRVFERLKALDALGDSVPGTVIDQISLRWLRKAPTGLLALREDGTSQRLRRWPYLLGALCARGEPGRAASRLQLDGAARSILRAMGGAAKTGIPGALTGRRPGSDADLDAALGTRAIGELLVYWLRGAAPARLRTERYLGHLRRTGPDMTGDQLIPHGVACGPAVGVGLRAARLAKLRGQEDRDAQLAAAFEAIRRWQRPSRRERQRPSGETTEETR